MSERERVFFNVHAVTLFKGIPKSRSRALYGIGNWNPPEVALFPSEGNFYATSIFALDCRMLLCKNSTERAS